MIDYTKSPDSFSINGVECSTVNVWCDTPSVPPMAKQRYTNYQTSADEDRTTPDESFEDVTYKLTFYTFDNENYDNRAIYAFITGARTLEISRLEGLYFKVRQVDLASAEASFKGNKIKYTATFKLAPFKYSTDNEEIELDSGDYIENTGSRYARPTLEVAGDGECEFDMNGDTFTLTLDDETVIVDSERYVVYNKSTGAVKHNAVSGWYPMLASGMNQLSWTGDVESVKIKKNERWY